VRLTSLSLNPKLVSLALIPISVSPRHLHSSRADAAGTDYSMEHRNPCSDVCPRLENETEHGITKNPFLMGTICVSRVILLSRVSVCGFRRARRASLMQWRLLARNRELQTTLFAWQLSRYLYHEHSYKLESHCHSVLITVEMFRSSECANRNVITASVRFAQINLIRCDNWTLLFVSFAREIDNSYDGHSTHGEDCIVGYNLSSFARFILLGVVFGK